MTYTRTPWPAVPGYYVYARKDGVESGATVTCSRCRRTRSGAPEDVVWWAPFVSDGRRLCSDCMPTNGTRVVGITPRAPYGPYRLRWETVPREPRTTWTGDATDVDLCLLEREVDPGQWQVQDGRRVGEDGDKAATETALLEAHRLGQRMPGTALKAIREHLGLTGEELAGLLHVAPRTERAWESGQDLIPLRVPSEVQQLQDATTAAVEAVKDRARSMTTPVVPVYRTDDEVRQAVPGALGGARWWRQVAARAAGQVSDAVIEVAEPAPTRAFADVYEAGGRGIQVDLVDVRTGRTLRDRTIPMTDDITRWDEALWAMGATERLTPWEPGDGSWRCTVAL